MSANLARRNRRVPVLCMLLILASLLICVASTSIYSTVTIISDIATDAVLRFDLAFDTVISTTLQNAVVFSSLFVFVIVIILLYKAKGWVLSIPAFMASALNLIIGLPMFKNGIVSFFRSIGVTTLSDIFKNADTLGESLKNTFNVVISYIRVGLSYPPVLTDYIYRVIPLLIAIAWFALGLSAIFSAVLHKTTKRGLRFSFGALTIAFGIIGSGVFAVSALANGLALLDCFFTFRYILLLLAPIMFVGNVLGFIGMILLSIYLVKPYKRGFKPEETDPEIIYAIDENDPVMNELDGTPTENVAEGELDEAAQAEEAERAAAYRQERAEEAAKAAAYRNEMQKAKARIKEQNEDAIREAAVKKSKSRWTPIFTFSFITLLLSLILEPGLLISTALGITGLIVMMCAKKKASIVVLGVLNMIFGGAIISLVAGILMMFIPEDTLL